jgi:ribosome-binding protein aMBF1 (putative translation factor)
MDGQDWQTITLMKNGRKAAATSHAPVSAGVAAARRLEADDIPKPKKSLSSESRQAILQGRVANKWNQTQLNTQCSFSQNTIRDIENGKLCPTPQQLNVLSRVLKVVLKYA